VLRLSKAARLSGDKVFGLILAEGKRKPFAGGEIFWRENGLGNCRFGFRVSSKAGNAVVRNGLRRRAREMVRKNRFLFNPGCDYLIVIKDKNLFPTIQDSKMAGYLFSLFGPDVVKRVS
jgi:ribonuclease P protein component